MLSVNLAQVRENLTRHPQIKNVEIEREFPGTLRIAVKERFGIAWLSCDFPFVKPPPERQSPAIYILLDEEGIPFVCESLMREYANLPVVHVSRLQELVPGKRLDNRQIQVALELLYTSRQALYDIQ
jgi:hypothetical protein